MLTSNFIPTPRNGKPGWHENFRNHNYLLSHGPSKIILIGDTIISNLGRYPDIWRKNFSNHNTLNFGIPGNKI